MSAGTCAKCGTSFDRGFHIAIAIVVTGGRFPPKGGQYCVTCIPDELVRLAKEIKKANRVAPLTNPQGKLE